MSNLASGAANAVTNVVSGGLTGTAGIVHGALNVANAVGTGALNAANKAVTGALSGVGTVATGVVGGAGNLVAGVLTGDVSRAVGGIQNIGSSALGGAGQIVGGALDGTREALKGVDSGIENIRGIAGGVDDVLIGALRGAGYLGVSVALATSNITTKALSGTKRLAMGVGGLSLIPLAPMRTFAQQMVCNAPWGNPMPLQEVQPKFTVYTKAGPESILTTWFKMVDVSQAPDFAKILSDEGYLTQKTQVIFTVHGFRAGGGGEDDWQAVVKTNLLAVEQENNVVINVDWAEGSNIIDYPLAAVTTQTVAKAISALASAILNSAAFLGKSAAHFWFLEGSG